MRSISVLASGGAYDIQIANGLLADAGAALARIFPQKRLAVVSDDTVWGLYGQRFSDSLASAGVEFFPTVVPPGEQSKSLRGLQTLTEFFAVMHLRRDEAVVALGGGVIGDLAGFAAATYMRGVAFAQVPTTLLAMVDSSVGGKTAVNLDNGKNLVGAFHQPRLVLADPGVLTTLPAREHQSGMAEVIKYGMLFSPALTETLLQGDLDMVETIAQCCTLKAGLVARDEHDHNERMLLNFGHTFGHVIEKLGRYTAHTHGEAVAMGMMMAAETGVTLGLTHPRVPAVLGALLARHGLQPVSPYPVASILQGMAHDKKAQADGLPLILLRDIGQPVIHPVALAGDGFVSV